MSFPKSNLPDVFCFNQSLVKVVQLNILKVTLVLIIVKRHPALSAAGEHCCSFKITEVPLDYSTLIACLPLVRYLP